MSGPNKSVIPNVSLYGKLPKASRGERRDDGHHEIPITVRVPKPIFKALKKASVDIDEVIRLALWGALRKITR